MSFSTVSVSVYGAIVNVVVRVTLTIICPPPSAELSSKAPITVITVPTGETEVVTVLVAILKT